MRSIAILLCLLSTTVNANSLSPLQKELSNSQQQLQKQLEQAPLNIANNIRNVDFSYIQNMGVILQIDLHQPLVDWLTEEASKNQDIQIETVEKPDPLAKQQFDQVRLTAKNLSHQIYSLEKQLELYTTNSKTNTPSVSQFELSKQEQTVNDIKQQLADLEQEKAIVNAQYKQLAQQKLTSTSQEKEISTSLFQDYLISLLPTLICENESLLSKLSKLDSINIIAKHSASKRENRYQDLVISIPNFALNACLISAPEKNDFMTQISVQEF